MKYVFVFGVLMLFLQCKEQSHPKETYRSNNFLYDSIQDKRIYLYNAREFQRLIKPESDSLYIFYFFTTYHQQSLDGLYEIDSFLDKTKRKVKLYPTSLDFYSSAREKLFEIQTHSEIVLILEPEERFWYKNLDQSWNSSPNRILFATNDSCKMIPFHDFDLTEQYLNNIYQDLSH